VLPGTRRLRLWRDALDNLGIGVDELPRALSRREKYLIEAGADDGSDRRRLSAVVLLTRESGGPVAVERLRGAQAVIALQGIVHMSEAARALGREPTIFTALTGLVAGGLSVWQLMLPDDRTYLDDAAAQVLALLSAG